MTTHLGIELSPGACRIVEIDARPPWTPHRSATRVRSFAVLPASGAETDARLASFAGRAAAVVVWDAASEHRQVVVSGGSYETMRAEALAALAAAGLETRNMLADIAPAGGRPKRGARQPVVVAVAASARISAALQPLRSAGIHVRAVTTPAAALGSLARLRRATAVPGTIEAYVALEESASCVALVRDAVLIAAHRLPWGYLDGRGGAAVRPREEIAGRIGDAIAEFVAAVGGEPRDIGQVCIAGGMPELRSMTLPLMERLDVEVEPLDSLFGIDAANLPAAGDDFRDRGAELRLAWAAAADWPPAINLLRAQRRQASKTMLSRAAVAAGIAAGLLGGWRVSQSAWWQSPTPATAARSAPSSANTIAAARGRAAVPATTVAVNRPPAAATPTAVAGSVGSRQSSSQSPLDAAQGDRERVERSPVASRQSPLGSPKSPSQLPVFSPQSAVALQQAQNDRERVERSAAALRQAQGGERSRTVGAPQGVAQSAPSASSPPRIEPAPASAGAAKLSPPPALAAPRADALRSSTAPPPARSAPASARAESARPTPQPNTQRPMGQGGIPSARSTPSAARVEPPPPTRSEPTAPTVVPMTPPRTAPLLRQEPPSVASPPAQSLPQLRSEPSAIAPARAAASVPRAVEAPSSARQRSAAPEVPLSFDAALGTILYSPDRKLAIVDGRIVGIGDEVRGAQIVDITATAVMLRDAQGRLRRLALGASGR